MTIYRPSYNTAPPKGGSNHQVIEIGWEHTVVADELILTLDDAGNPIPRRYKVPTRLPQSKVATAVADAMAKAGDEGTEFGAKIEALNKLVPGGVVKAVGADLTVTTLSYVAFVSTLGRALGLNELLGGPSADDEDDENDDTEPATEGDDAPGEA